MSDLRKKFLKETKDRIQTALKSRDMLVANVSKSIKELDEVINVLGERLDEWYGVYFPELKLENRYTYARIVTVLDRKNPSVGKLDEIVGVEYAKKLAASARSSLGAELEEKDLMQCKGLAEKLLSLYELRKTYNNYETVLVNELAPNMTHVAGADIAAQLIAHIGSLNRLAFLPASTIQVLGAEKALFKHLRNKKIAPPKHGILFQHPKISSNPKKVRGKIARTLANKIAIAAKADAFTRNFIGDKLKDEFNKRCEEILSEYRTKKEKE